MSQFNVRPALSADCETIASYNCRLAEETENIRLDPETIRAGVERVLGNPREGRYFVVCQGEQIIGQMMHTWEWSDWRNGQIWWLQSVYVAPDFRRQGVFRMLYEHALDIAKREPDVVGIRLYVERENNRAQNTYQQLGMADAGYVVMEQLFV